MKTFFAKLSQKTWYPKAKEEVFSWINTFLAATTLMAIITLQQIDITKLDVATGAAILGVVIRTAIKYGITEVLKTIIKRLEK